MALSIPNTFTSGTTIEADKIQENVDAIKEYLQGEILTSDIGEDWVEPQHIMKGVYFSTNNTYEMVSGVHVGTPVSELPVWNPGYAGAWLGEGNVPGATPAGISFYIEKEADVFLQFQLSPRLPAFDASADGGALEIRLDGAETNESQCRFSVEWDLIDNLATGVDGFGFYRRRFYQSSMLFPVVSAGYHHISLYYRGSPTAVPLKFCSYSLKALYRP